GDRHLRRGAVRRTSNHRLDLFSPYSISGAELMSASVGGLACGLLVWERSADARLSAASLLLGFSMVLITVIDRRLFLIPDLLSLPAAVLGLITALLAGPEAGVANFTNHLAAALVASGMLLLLRALYR